MAVAIPSMARDSHLASLSTPRAAHQHADPATGRSLEGDTLLGSPDGAQPVLSSPSTNIAKRLTTASGRIEKKKATQKSSIAQKLFKLFTSFPSLKRAFFARS